MFLVWQTLGGPTLVQVASWVVVAAFCVTAGVQAVRLGRLDVTPLLWGLVVAAGCLTVLEFTAGLANGIGLAATATDPVRDVYRANLTHGDAAARALFPLLGGLSVVALMSVVTGGLHTALRHVARRASHAVA